MSKSEEEFLTSFEFVNDAVFILDQQGNFIHTNRIAHERLGYTRKQLLSMHISELSSSESPPKVSSMINHIQKHGKAVFESALIRKDGTIMPVEVNSRVIDFKGQEVFLSVIRDITERKKVEKTLKDYHDNLESSIRERTGELEIINNALSVEIMKRKRSEIILLEKEKRFRAAATSTSDLIWEGDVRSNDLIWFGDIDGLLGYKIGEFPRTVSGHMESIHTEDIDQISKTIERSLKTGEDFYAEYRIRCKDGTYRYWEERGKAIEFEKGKAVKWVGSATDITRRKHAIDKIIESEARYKSLSQEFNSLLDAISDNLILLTPDLKILWANNAFASKFGKDVSDLKEKHCYKLCCNISTACKNCPVLKSFKSGHEEATRVMNTEGRIFDKRAFPIKDSSGQAIKVIEISRDITANVRMEEEAKLIQSRLMHANKMTSLGTLVSGVAHEINNPNSFIMSNAGVFSKIWKDAVKILTKEYHDNGDFQLAGIPFSEIQETAPQLLSGISEGSTRIRKIVENLRDFSRPEKANLRGKVDVNAVIMSSRSILDNHIRKFTNHFNIACKDDLPLVKGSTQQIEQVVINIIINALQSLKDKNSGIRISTSYIKKSNLVTIKVKDEGIGIADEIINHVTEPFFTTKLGIGGTGLGLSISYSIVKEHKGSLVLKSIEGKGTTVFIKLPAIK